jgi:hypothetical protein
MLSRRGPPPGRRPAIIAFSPQSSLFAGPPRRRGAAQLHSNHANGGTVARMQQPIEAKERADEIADLITEACEKLVDLSTEWFALNDKEGLIHAHRMLRSREVTLMLSARVEQSGLAHIGLNLLRTETPMPRPFFEIQVPMMEWTLNAPGVLFDDPAHAPKLPGKEKGRNR